MLRKALVCLALVVACPAAAPAVASAASVRAQIYEDCEDGTLNGSYTPAQLRDARQQLQGDLAQYSDCADLLRDAEIPDRPGTTAGSGEQTPGTDSLGSTAGQRATTAADAATLAQAVKAAEKPVTAAPVQAPDVDKLRPAGVVRLDRSGNALPAPLVVVLTALGLGLLATTAPAARRLAGRLRHRR